ncbi:hypothetical protein WME99_12620 [Sorangium sp. So ce136]|uniref:hypothetical protein n=1 Tax=Sorangium sp. So ce136 TaxID=3133284 RepID=UPI003F092DD0
MATRERFSSSSGRAPHPATVVQERHAPGAPGPGARPPHPATVVQPRPAPSRPAARPPHPATVVQKRPAPAAPGPGTRPPHPATVVQPRPAPSRPAARPPHPATVVQKRPAPTAPGPRPPHAATTRRPAGASVLQRSEVVGADQAEETVWIREDGVDYAVSLTLTARDVVKYSKTEDCGNAAHVTRTSGLRFEHIHVNYALPKRGFDDDGVEREVTVAKVNAYWDAKFGEGYTRETDADVTCNCIAYALGYPGTWIEPDADARGVIAADDYDTTVIYAADNVEWRSTHNIKIVEVYEDGGKIKKTREKNGQSGVYRRDYASPGEAVGEFYSMKKLK